MRCCHLPAAVESTENVHATTVRAAAATLSAASHSGDMQRTRFRHTLHKAAASWCEYAPQKPLAAARRRLCTPRQTLCGQQHTDSCSQVLQHARSPGRTLLCLWQLEHICSRAALSFCSVCVASEDSPACLVCDGLNLGYSRIEGSLENKEVLREGA